MIKTKNNTAQFTRKSVLTAIQLSLCAGMLPAALAADESERVEVTGTRIRRTDVETVNPVLTLDRDEIEKTGVAKFAGRSGREVYLIHS